MFFFSKSVVYSCIGFCEQVVWISDGEAVFKDFTGRDSFGVLVGYILKMMSMNGFFSRRGIFSFVIFLNNSLEEIVEYLMVFGNIDLFFGFFGVFVLENGAFCWSLLVVILDCIDQLVGGGDE